MLPSPRTDSPPSAPITRCRFLRHRCASLATILRPLPPPRSKRRQHAASPATQLPPLRRRAPFCFPNMALGSRVCRGDGVWPWMVSPTAGCSSRGVSPMARCNSPAGEYVIRYCRCDIFLASTCGARTNGCVPAHCRSCLSPITTGLQGRCATKLLDCCCGLCATPV
jgi:hypothetical protein